MDMKKNVRQTLCDALEDLLEQQFKAFKGSLPDTDEGRKVPRGQLERADRQDVADLMCCYYGEEGAPEICIRVLEKINARDVAVNLREALPWHVLGFGLQQVPTKADYRSHIQRKFQTMKDANSCPGQTVLLKKRYSELIIIDCDWSKKERAHKIKSTDQKHAELMDKRARSSTTVEMLFKPDKHGQIPEVVVLLGASGIGKTMTARKIMLDWASGQLYQDMFDYLFYIHCREMNLCTEEKSMVEIILKQWPNEHALKNVAKELLTEIFRNPKKILFLIDGFDELSLFMDLPEGQLCSDPWKKEQVGILLSSLFQKKMLFDCYMIITTRPTALMKIDRFLQYSRYVEILGFSEKDKEEYFHKFFQNDDQAKQAVRHIKHNGALFTMCSVPLVCWIMCTVLQQQLERGEELGQTSSTLTAVYMLYLKFHHRQRKQEIQRIIKGLCALAADGIRRQEILFREDMIRKHGLDKEDSLSLFLNENIFKEGIECVCAYSFIHLSFQEFFAALHYVQDVGIMHILKRSNQDVRTLLESYSSSRPDLQVTVCFLFGLINEERMRGLKEMFRWNISFVIKKTLLAWVKASIFHIDLPWESSSLSQFLYETQDENFVKRALQDSTVLSVYASSLMELITTVYCLEHSFRLKHLGIQYDSENKDENEIDGDTLILERETVDRLFKAVQALRSNFKYLFIEVPQYCLTEAHCRDLASLLSTGKTLTTLSLGQRFTDCAGFYLFCEALKSPNCRLERLNLTHCIWTEVSCEHFAQVLMKNQSLRDVELLWSEVKIPGIKLLFEGLKHSSCKQDDVSLFRCTLTGASSQDVAQVLSKVQSVKVVFLFRDKAGDVQVTLSFDEPRLLDNSVTRLCMDECYLTATWSEELAQVLIKNLRLNLLVLNENVIGDTGVTLLWEGLTHPHCKAETLSLQVSYESDTSEHLAHILINSKRLQELFQELHGMQDPGMKMLCEWLRHPDCQVEMLRLPRCHFTEACSEKIAQILINNQMLRVLFLDLNGIEDTRMRILWEGLKHPDCKTEELYVRSWNSTTILYEELAQFLIKNQRLKVLELDIPRGQSTGMKILCQGLAHSECKVERLCLHNCLFTEACFENLVQVLIKNQSLKLLALHMYETGSTRMKPLWAGLKHQECKVEKLHLQYYSSTKVFYEEIARVLIKNQRLKLLELDMSHEASIGMKILCERLKHPECKVEKLCLSSSCWTQTAWEALAQVLITSQRLQVLCLKPTYSEDIDVTLLCKALRHPDCKLQKLYLSRWHVTDAFWEAICTALTTNPSLTEVHVSETRLEESKRKQFRLALKDSGKALRVNRRRIDMEDDGNSEELEESDHCRIGKQTWLSKRHECIMADYITEVDDIVKTL